MFYRSIISFLITIVQFYYMECSCLSSVICQQLKYIFNLEHLLALTTSIKIHDSFSLTFPTFWPKQKHHLINSKSDEIDKNSLLFPYIMSSIKCVFMFLSAKRKHLEQMKQFNLSLSIIARWFKLWFESFMMLLFRKTRKGMYFIISRKAYLFLDILMANVNRTLVPN